MRPLERLVGVKGESGTRQPAKKAVALHVVRAINLRGITVRTKPARLVTKIISHKSKAPTTTAFTTFLTKPTPTPTHKETIMCTYQNGNHSSKDETPISRMQLINMVKALYQFSTDQQQEQQLPRRRGVRFSPIVSTVEPTSPLRLAQVKELCWIPTEQLQAFKSEARQLARAGILDNGLEGATLERYFHRHSSVQCTIEAHRQGLGAEHTAMVSRQCSAWSEELAFVQACHDYLTIYQPELVSHIPAVASILPSSAVFPSESFVSKKRTGIHRIGEEVEGRRVRQRTSTAV
jgi:hypothetical protein